MQLRSARGWEAHLGVSDSDQYWTFLLHSGQAVPLRVCTLFASPAHVFIKLRANFTLALRSLAAWLHGFSP